MLKRRDFLLLLLIASVWGASYIFIRILVPVLGPWGLVCARMLIAGTALLIAASVLRRPWGQWRLWKRYLIVALTASFVSQFLISHAALTLNAPTLSILNASTAVFGAALSVYALGEPLRATRACGLVLGIAGVAMVVGFTPLAFTWPVILAFAASLAAAFGYAVANVYAMRKLADRPALELSIAQNIFAGVMALPLGAPAVAAAWPPSGLVLGSLLALALVCTAAANWLYYILLMRTSPTVALSVTYLIPCFSLLWGALFLAETITLLQCAGFLVVLAALYLVTARRLG
jgi:drug/metabolite transporter (DMT)-like permease